tara:strand:+ start:922 stop:1176 length:255 start_codon:yes stop_codon:yes gene_type:complete
MVVIPPFPVLGLPTQHLQAAVPVHAMTITLLMVVAEAVLAVVRKMRLLVEMARQDKVLMAVMRRQEMREIPELAAVEQVVMDQI